MLSQFSAFPPLSESPLEVSDVRPQPIFFDRYRAPRAPSVETSIQSCRTANCPQLSWAPSPLPRSWERVPMATGVPRRTLSLCPECNREAVDSVIRGERSVTDFSDRPGIIEAEIIEEAGRILMRKACEKHGHLKTCFRIIQPSSGWRGWLLARTPIVPAMKSFTITALTALREGGART
jgi:hypothetical protein